jgi:hypothetical protein
MQRQQPESVLNTMNAVERARAQEGMMQSMFLAELALAGVDSIRFALDCAGQAMFLAFGRDRI